MSKGEMKRFKIILVFKDGSNCQALRLAENEKKALQEFMNVPEVREHNIAHTLVDVKIEELGELPIPPENRFWLERRDDGVYVIIDEKRKRALTFEFGHYRETVKYTDFMGEKPPMAVINTDFLMEADIWLKKYHPSLIG